MSAYVLEARDLWLPRGAHWALEVPHLGLRRGEVLTLLGPNGAGKSTLVAVLAALLPPRRGQVRFHGRPVDFRNSLAYRRRIAVVLQRPYLLRGTVEDNVALGLRLHGFPPEERRRRVRYWLRHLGLQDLAHRSARKLSGGQAQRVALARALALEPEVLFLDEPFQALDLPTRYQLLEELQDLLRQTGTTTVYVTHDVHEGLALAQRVAVLVQGRLRQVGSPQEVLTRPVDQEVARVVGMETLLPARVLEAQGETLLVQVGSRTLRATGRGRPGMAVLLGMRPEALQVLPSSPAGAVSDNSLPARVHAVWPQTGWVRLVLKTPEGLRLVARLPQERLATWGLRPGDPVEVRVAPSDAWVLPAAGEAMSSETHVPG